MRPRRYILGFTTIAIGAIAIAGCGGSSGSSSSSGAPASSASAPAANAVAAPAPLTQSVTLLIKSDTEKARRGSDGQWHDAFLPGGFSVKAGATVKVTVWNYDSAHSFTAPSLGVNQTLKGGTQKAPHMTTFTFKAPSKAGSYQWFCAMPCDPWAMAHNGYMRGIVKVTA
jgi:plastocyanin